MKCPRVTFCLKELLAFFDTGPDDSYHLVCLFVCFLLLLLLLFFSTFIHSHCHGHREALAQLLLAYKTCSAVCQFSWLTGLGNKTKIVHAYQPLAKVGVSQTTNHVHCVQ